MSDYVPDMTETPWLSDDYSWLPWGIPPADWDTTPDWRKEQIYWSIVNHPHAMHQGLSQTEIDRLSALDEKDADGTLTEEEREELDQLLARYGDLVQALGLDTLRKLTGHF